MKHLATTITFILFLSLSAHGQYNFYSSYQNIGYVEDVLSAIDGDLIVLAADGATTDAHLFRTNCMGSVKWSVKLGNDDPLNMLYISEAPNENIYALGMMIMPGGIGNILVLQFSETGALNWAKRYYYQSTNYAWDIQATHDNGFIIVGGGCSGSNFVFRGDTTGNIIWQKQYAESSVNGTSFHVLPISDDKFVVHGTSVESPGEIGLNLFQIDGSGNLEWFKHYDGTAEEYPSELIALENGDYVMTRSTKRMDTINGDPAVIRTDNNGNLIWAHVLDCPEWSGASSIVQTASDKLVVAGSYLYQGTLNTQGLLVGMDLNGSVDWAKTTGNLTFSGLGSDNLNTLSNYHGSSLIYAGSLDGIALGRINLDGSDLCSEDSVTFPIVNHSMPVTIPAVNVGNLNFTMEDEVMDTVYAVLQEDELCGNTDDELVCPQSLSLPELESTILRISPNPSTGTFYIHTNRVNLNYSVYDSKGRAITGLQPLISDSIELTGESGIYFVHFYTDEGYLDSRKISVTK